MADSGIVDLDMADSGMADSGMEKEERDFTDKMDTIVSHGYLSMSIAIGSQMGLFDVMATMESPATAAEIAEKAGCKERWVRDLTVKTG